MGLIISEILKTGLVAPPGATKFKFPVHKNFLSFPYGLKPSKIYIVVAEIRDVRGISSFGISEVRGVEGLKNKEMKFILEIGEGPYDWLYISEDIWPEIRDYGILAEQYMFSLILKKIEYDGKVIEVYPKRNVEV